MNRFFWTGVIALLSANPSYANVVWEEIGQYSTYENSFLKSSNINEPIRDEEADYKNLKSNDEWIDPFDIDSDQKSNDREVIWTLVPEKIIDHSQIYWKVVLPSETNDLQAEKIRVPEAPAPKLESLNRSIAFSDGRVGPDISFLVPSGFRWTQDYILDTSTRGWSRRKQGERFLAWNNGDAVGQFYMQPFHGKKWSFGGSLGIRSITSNPNNISQSAPGEGVSAGFRLDYALSTTSGIAFGAEQLVHFDDKTDTGRDIYLVASKGWWLGDTEGDFPLVTATAGIGTGYLGRNTKLQFGCSNISDAGIAEVDNPQFYPLCWGPVAAASIVITPKLSFFSEFNNFAFVTGASIAPFKRVPLRATWGATLAQDFGGGPDDYRFEPDKTRWFFRISLGL